MRTLLQDVRYALRMLARSPAFTLGAVAVAASALPARRAARLDPIAALRTE